MKTNSSLRVRTADSHINSQNGDTRWFWLGYLFGGAIGAVLGLFIGDIAGWIYMCGTAGCFIALGLDPESRKMS